MDLDNILNEKEVIYIFGYGSLTWKPDFAYSRQTLGYIKDYERRFWQGSTYHRGTEEKPGRCLTLTKVKKATCWGLVYEVRGPDLIAEALDYLNIREQALGGYEVYVVPVYLHEEKNNKSEPVYSVVYVATPECKGFLGDGSVDQLADDIATSSGVVGHNIEYLFRLADFMRKHLPDEKDDHLYELDKRVREKVGLSTSDIKPWKQLLEDPIFRRLVKGTDYRAKWKNAITAMMSDTHEIDRWTDLLYRIKRTKERGMSELETVYLATVKYK